MGSCFVNHARPALTEEAYELSHDLLRSSWWLVAKSGDDALEVLTLDGGNTLPVFSGEDEAGLFAWLRRAHEHGWEVRRSSAGELVSVLGGACSCARLVALDPTIEIFDAEPPNLSREAFIGWMDDLR